MNTCHVTVDMGIPDLSETSNMDLRTLLEVLFRAGGICTVKAFFEAHAYRIMQPCKGTRLEDVVVGVKYIDGLNNLWRPVWAREARGRFYYYDVDTQTVHCLKDSLQRGAEVLTHAHRKSSISETQDVRMTFDHLDEIQQQCIRTFQSEAPLDAFLTGKVDGSLIVVSVYPRETVACRIMEEIMKEDAFSSVLLEVCGGPLISVATQGTLLIGDDMQDYFVTALQSLLGPLPKTTLKAAWASQAPQFVKAVLDTTAALGYQRIHLCFEAVCKGRQSLWGRFHNELTISYESNGFNLLGAMVDNRYIPHFDMPQHIFAQPIFRRISSTKEAFELMEGMDRVVMGELEESVFLEKWGWPPAMLHMEGWVLLTPHKGGYDYAKIKTALYYKCHKIRACEIPALLALPTSCDKTYPILHVLRDFHNHAEERLLRTVAATVEMLETEVALGASSAFYEALSPKARIHFVPERKDTLLKMIMNACVSLFRTRVMEILQKEWTNPPGDMVLLIRQILVNHMPWKSPLTKEVVKTTMKDLYSILVESMDRKV